MQLFLERLIYFWAGITFIGIIGYLIYVAFFLIIVIAFYALLVAILTTLFYHFYWSKRDN